MAFKNKEVAKEYFKTRYELNKELILIKRKTHYQKIKQQHQKKCSEYYRANKTIYSAKKAARLYKLTLEYVLELRKITNCNICNIEIFGKTQHIDHCHTTGRIRGVLCNNCNGLLGMVEKITQRGISPMNIFTYLNTAEVSFG